MALDATYRYTGNTHVTGYTGDSEELENPPIIVFNTGFSDALGFAPAIEYSWKSNVGVIFGTRIIQCLHGTAITVTPAIAIDLVR